MIAMTKVLAALSACAALFFSIPVDALEIQQFDKLATSDQAAFLDLLVRGTEQALIDELHPELADKVHSLFNTSGPETSGSTGMTELASELAKARIADLEHATDYPDTPRFEVENAMESVLKKHNVTPPKSLSAVTRDFEPELPFVEN